MFSHSPFHFHCDEACPRDDDWAIYAKYVRFIRGVDPCDVWVLETSAGDEESILCVPDQDCAGWQAVQVSVCMDGLHVVLVQGLKARVQFPRILLAHEA